MTDNQLVGGDTESGDEQNQDARLRSFTQDEVNEIVSERVAKERKRFEQRYRNVDLDRYNKLVEAEENGRMQAAQTRAEFESILQETVGKKDQTIKQLQAEIQAVKIDGRLLDLASRNRAVNPSQVVQLLKDQVRLNEGGEVEVINPQTGKLRYTDKGQGMDLAQFVTEWLDQNPHFVQATPAGSGTQSQRGGTGAGAIDITKLNMDNAADRKLYREYRQQRQH